MVIATEPTFSEQPPTASSASLLAAGMALWANDGISPAGVSAREKATFVKDDPRFVSACASYARHPLSNVGVRGALYATWVANPTLWTQFWDAVFEESDPSPDSATRVLARYLRTEKRTRSKADVRCTLVKCLHAWNAWRTGSSTNLHYYADRPIPKVLT